MVQQVSKNKVLLPVLLTSTPHNEVAESSEEERSRE